MRGGWVALAFVLAANAAAQNGFEVASVRRVTAVEGRTSSLSPPDVATFTARSMPMKVLLQLAFGVEDNQIQSKADWLDNEYYDIVAKPEGERVLTRAELQPLLERLLDERFQLKVHRETRDVRGYWLTVAKAGSKLQPGKQTEAMPYILPNALSGASLSMKSLAGMLARLLHQPVVDHTGLAGDYAVKLRFAPQGATDSDLPSLFTALDEQMGLKLESHAVPVDFVVVDHIEKMPVEN